MTVGPEFMGRVSFVAGPDLGLSKQQSERAMAVVGPSEADGEVKVPVDSSEKKALHWGLFSLSISWRL